MRFFNAPTAALLSITRLALALGLLNLGACGGGSGGAMLNDTNKGSDTGSGDGRAPAGSVGFPASASLAAQCVNPRSGTDPATGRAYPDRQGTLAKEKAWLRSWTHELYLWYREVPDPDADAFNSIESYFAVLKTSAKTSSGRDKDRFHFTYPTDVWYQQSVSGQSAGYGVEWVAESSTPPRRFLAAYVLPGSAADLAGIRRGTEVLTVDGVDLATGEDTDALNAGLFPAKAGESHQFSVRDLGASEARSLSLVSALITLQPVMNVKTFSSPRGNLGYLQFNDHIASAEAALVAAIDQLKAAAVTELIIDLRYNGGGYLDIASELAYMVAGPARSAGKTFEQLQFNDQHPSIDPVTRQRIVPTGFHATAQGFSVQQGTRLPSLDLARVFVLTGAGTCSASEALINGLRGIDVEVIQIGSTTCGKPYGFYPQDNCGTTFFSIQFRGINAKGFGDYADGFVPAGTGAAGVTGCVVEDDYSHELGYAAEARLAAALYYAENGACPLATAALRHGAASGEGQLFRTPFRENRILRQR